MPHLTISHHVSRPQTNKCHLLFGPDHLYETVKSAQAAHQLRRVQLCREWGKTAEGDAEFVARHVLSRKELCRHSHWRYRCKEVVCMQSGATGICEHSRQRSQCQ